MPLLSIEQKREYVRKFLNELLASLDTMELHDAQFSYNKTMEYDEDNSTYLVEMMRPSNRQQVELKLDYTIHPVEKSKAVRKEKKSTRGVVLSRRTERGDT